jgi:hypothetical protein
VALLAKKAVDEKVVASFSQVRKIDTTKGMERATYNASSVPGDCGGAVVDQHNRCVGIHRATNAEQDVNVFGPFTRIAVGLMSGLKLDF